MSFLAPFYILGALAIAAPIVFHLIRRAPRGEVPFSSLMFLTATPPRLTKRSRLDNWLLLLLRAAALGLLAFAFARPFLRQTAFLDSGTVQRQRVAVLIDASASLQRGDLWPKALKLARGAIDECRPGDELAVFAFDTTTRTLIGFDESATLDPAQRTTVAKSRLDGLSPTWGGTDLGRALVDAVSAVRDAADASEEAGRMPRRVVLVSDLQRGSRLDLLGGFEWPSDVTLELKAVADDRPNAGLQWLAAAGAGEDPEGEGHALRVRVSNDPGANREQFTLRWSGEGGGEPVEVYVPPGESRVARIPRPLASAAVQPRALLLEGDSHPFDNTLYLAEDRREEATVLAVIDGAADDPAGLLYYLERAFPDLPGRTVRVRQSPPSSVLTLTPGESVPLIVLAGDTTPENISRIKEHVRLGNTLLFVLTDPARAETLSGLMDAPIGEAKESPNKQDAMLGTIAFDHSLFAPFAGAQFNDFTKIRFWKYRILDAGALGDARILANFEDGSPAIIEKALDRGRIVALTSGWAPGDSQLARSSKFVPLMMGLLDAPGSRRLDAAGLRVHDAVPLPPPTDPTKGWVVRKPDGTNLQLEPGVAEFTGTDHPGIYAIDAGGTPQTFAVNIDPAEGSTAPLAPETLEQLGCRLASGPPEAIDPEQLRQMRNVELEGRQQIWRGLILAAIGILIIETLLAGRHARPRATPAEATPS